MLTRHEQFFVEMTNRLRLNPQAEADRLLGGDLNAGIAAYNAGHGTSYDLRNAGPMQVLAPNAALKDAALLHSDWMLAQNSFSHAGDPQFRGHPDYPGTPGYPINSSPGERMAAAGYEFGGTWRWAENLSYTGTTGVLDEDAAIVTHYKTLFQSPGHRVNLLDDLQRETGVGVSTGPFYVSGTIYNTSMLTQEFAKSGSDIFLTGVSYDDINRNGVYDLGEGTGGTEFAANGRQAITWDAGGYSLSMSALASIPVSVTSMSGTINATVSLASGNVKLDLVDGAILQSSGNLVLGGGATDARLLGAADLSLTGNDQGNRLMGAFGDDTLTGGAGDDLLEGGAGRDMAVYSGDQSSYTLTLSPGGTTLTDRRADGNGTDTLIDMEFLDFDTEIPALRGNPMNLDRFGGPVALNEAQFADLIELYIAYFNRAPDATGLYFWATAFSNGRTLEEIAARFDTADETRALYPDDSSNAEFVEAVYNNVLGRDPDQGGFDFWLGHLNSGTIPRDVFISRLLNGAQGTDIDYIENKVDIGIYFTVIKGMSDPLNGLEVMELFDGSQQSIEDAIDTTDQFYADALDPTNGEFLMPLVGVLDDPFAVV